MLIVPIAIILSWCLILILIGTVIGYILPVFKRAKTYVGIILAYAAFYALLVYLEIPIGLMIPFILGVALIINISRFLKCRLDPDAPIRFITIASILGGTVVVIFCMGLFGQNYNYPEGENYQKMAKEGYSNLARRNPIAKLFTTHYHAKIYYVKNHCPIADDGRNPNRDYVIATYEKAFGITNRIVYHNCGYGKFWGGAQPEWELSKDKLVAKSG